MIQNSFSWIIGIQPKVTNKEVDNFTFDLMDCLRSPIITHSSLWANTLPKDALDKVTPERLIALLFKEKKATISEIVLYLYTASLEAPLSYEWAEIYTWCGLQFARKYRNEETIKQIIQIAPDKLSNYNTSKLESLRIWIYNKRRKALKEKLRK